VLLGLNRSSRTLLIEAEILDWWRGELAWPAYLGPQDMKQGGWTETVGTDEIDLALTMRRIRHSAGEPGQGEAFEIFMSDSALVDGRWVEFRFSPTSRST
jgi:hypothetical protein